MSNCAATGAVTNTNTAISSSCQLARPAQANTSAAGLDSPATLDT